MLRLLIFIASFSAAVPLLDFTEPYSEQTLVSNDPVLDANIFYDTVPIIGVSSVTPSILASNSETNPESNTKSDAGIQEISNPNLGNLAFNLNALGPSIQLDGSVPSPQLQPASPLVLASNSGPDENLVTVDSTEQTDQLPWTVAQSSGSVCRTDDSKGSDTKKIDACPNPMNAFIRAPRGHAPSRNTPAEFITREKRDEAWVNKNIENVFVSNNHQDICNRKKSSGTQRHYPFCCVGGVIRVYDPATGLITDQLNCVALIPGRPCEKRVRNRELSARRLHVVKVGGFGKTKVVVSFSKEEIVAFG
ncbi:hypothetical protein MMC07_001644 [Pseudocyphellaria aurata]|nr:hypothetical protein [Pseudocyphellaria aurata]